MRSSPDGGPPAMTDIPAWAVRQATEEMYDSDDPEAIARRARQLWRQAEEREAERHDEYDDPDEGGEA